jgi:perosamine synthetase
MRQFIPVSQPALVGNERKYVLDCLSSTWISSNGKYIDEFEAAFANFCGAKHAITCCNGTVALHLALLALGVKSGDEVLVPTLTYVATANAVTYCGARPVFVDSEEHTWNIDPSLIERFISPRTKGIIVVHLYGHPANMDPIVEVARRRGLFIIEDAAEAHGAEYKGRKVGSIGDVATFSFYGNKIITTGEGGMVVTNDDRLADKIRQLRGQGQDPNRRYWFPIVGYNYRMTNVAAAIGLAQLEKVEWHIARRRENAALYRKYLMDCQSFILSPEMPWAKSVYWLTCLLVKRDFRWTRDEVMQKLAKAGIETRPFFYPMHTLPMYRETNSHPLPVAEDLSKRGLNLPSSALLSQEEIRYIADVLLEIDAE